MTVNGTTGTGTRSLADIKANIDRHFNLYGSAVVSGIFLDEMSSSESQIEFYRQIYPHIKARSTNLRVIGNPGAIPAAAYANVVDAMVNFEDTASNFQKTAVQAAASARYNHGLVYVTNLQFQPSTQVGNPAQLLERVGRCGQAVNAGTTLPGCWDFHHLDVWV